jgi:hypothetical protein
MIATIHALGQYPTPQWLAERIVETYFADLTASDVVLEPSCHLGHFLAAVPAHVPAIGVEIDPLIARGAEVETGRRVYCGDFRTIALSESPTCIVGNPPFNLSLIEAFLRRSRELLPDAGRAGFILPAYCVQSSRTALRLTEGWRVQAELLPRDVYPRLRLPLLFVRFQKAAQRTLVGFAFYAETAAIASLPTSTRATLAQRGGSAWAALVDAALDALGGRAQLADIYRWVEGKQPTANRWWREKLRQQLQRHHVRLGDGWWQRSPQLALAA